MCLELLRAISDRREAFMRTHTHWNAWLCAKNLARVRELFWGALLTARANAHVMNVRQAIALA